MSETNRTLTLNLGGGEEMTLNLGESATERLELGSSFPVFQDNYDLMKNKPQVNGVTLEGNKTTRQLKIEVTDPLTNLEIEDMLNTVFN